MAKEPASTLARKSEAELHEIAVGIATNLIFTDSHVNPKDIALIPVIFAPLGFLGKKELLALQRRERPGMLYTYMAKAGPRAINGYPMFFEMSMLHPEDAKIVWHKHAILTQAMK